MRRNLACRTAGLAILTVVLGDGPAWSQEIEPDPVFQAADWVAADNLNGPGWRVAADVPNDGVLNHYRIETDDGVLEVAGTDLVEIRLHELRAVAAMRAVQKKDRFREAARAAATGPLDFAKDMIRSPRETAGDVVEGVGTFFDSVGHAMFGDPSEEEVSVVETMIGFDAVKRATAAEFGVDPYSGNPILQAELEEVSWTAFAGGLGPKALFSLVPGTAGLVVKGTSFSDGMAGLIATKTAAELDDLNREKLLGLGVDPAIAEVFLGHPKFSPTRATFIVGALEQMTGAENLGALLDVAVAARTTGDAFLWQLKAEMFAAYHVNVTPSVRLVRVGADVGLLTADRQLIGTIPNDFVAWNAALSQRAMSQAGKAAEATDRVVDREDRQIWLTRGISPLARENIETLGWTVVADAEDRLRLP